MKNVVSLLKLLIKGQSLTPKNTQKKSYGFLGLSILILILIPCCIFSAVVSYLVTIIMLDYGGGSEGMLFIIQFVSACAFIFGLNVVISEFYFSSDIDRLLPLPVKSDEIILSKFIVTYIFECMLESLIILSVYIGYMMASGITVIKVINAIIGTLTLPIVPLVFCGVISLIIMYLFKYKSIKNRSALNIIMAILGLLLIFLIFISFYSLKNLTAESYIMSIINGQNLFINFMKILFFPGHILLTSSSILNSIIYIVLTSIYLIIFLIIAKFTYLDGLYNFKSISAKKSNNYKKELSLIQSSPSKAYFKKELKTIFRTPAFLTDCVLINLFIPAIILVICLIKNGNSAISSFINLISNNNNKYLLLDLFLLLASFTTAENGIASSSFTREGKHIDFIKYTPLSFNSLIHVKANLSLIFSSISYLIDLIILGITLKFNFLMYLYFSIIGFSMIFSITYIGIILDSSNPKLIWEDELNALRGNLSVFINMAIAILFTIIICIATFLLNMVTNYIAIYVFSILLSIIVNILLYKFSIKKICENIEKL